MAFPCTHSTIYHTLKLEKPTLGSETSAFPAHSSVAPGTPEPLTEVPWFGGEEKNFLLLRFFHLCKNFILHWWKAQVCDPS